MAISQLVIPGQVLGPTLKYDAGPGTHINEENIYASIAGPLATLPSPASGSATKVPSKPILTVSRDIAPEKTTPKPSNSTLLPLVGSTVLCTVTRVQSRQAVCLILSVIPPPTSSLSSISPFIPSEALNFPALLRREDVRLTEKDRVVMNEAVRVGDLIRAQVISIGDEKQYYVSTAGNEFGVLAAKAQGDGVEAGGWMTGISWKEMRDLKDKSGKSETRKVAKPS